MQEKPLYRLSYWSRVNEKKSVEEIEKDIQNILKESQNHNAKYNITGVLVTNYKIYSQVIEGPAEVIKTLIGHIICDPRNESLEVINKHFCDERIFGNWAMAFLKVDTDSEAETYLFPTAGGQLNIKEISIFCDSVKQRIIIDSMDIGPEILTPSPLSRLH